MFFSNVLRDKIAIPKSSIGLMPNFISMVSLEFPTISLSAPEGINSLYLFAAFHLYFSSILLVPDFIISGLTILKVVSFDSEKYILLKYIESRGLLEFI